MKRCFSIALVVAFVLGPCGAGAATALAHGSVGYYE